MVSSQAGPVEKLISFMKVVTGVFSSVISQRRIEDYNSVVKDFCKIELF